MENENDIREEYRMEQLEEARSCKRDLLFEEFLQSVSKEDIVKEILENITKKELIEILVESDIDDTNVYSEFKEEMFGEYCEHR